MAPAPLRVNCMRTRGIYISHFHTGACGQLVCVRVRLARPPRQRCNDGYAGGGVLRFACFTQHRRASYGWCAGGEDMAVCDCYNIMRLQMRLLTSEHGEHCNNVAAHGARAWI